MENQNYTPIYDRKSLDKYEDLDFGPVIEKEEFKYVYRPGDDSLLFLDALRFELDNMLSLKPTFFLEIGSGSGFLINSIARWYKEKNSHLCQFFASDINYDAAFLTKRVSNHYNNDLEVLHTNIVSGLQRKNEMFDIIICNPPYVPTDSEELVGFNEYLKKQNEQLRNKLTDYKRDQKYNGIDASYGGGLDANEITVKILAEAKQLLTPNGIFYLLLIEDNKPRELLEEYFPEIQYDITCLLYQQFHNERIYIFKIMKKKN